MPQLNAIISDSLLIQAKQITGMQSDKALLEYALKLVIALQSVTKPSQNKEKTTLKLSNYLAPSEFESENTPSVYQGKPLSLDDMQTAIQNMAEKHK
ncbi:hypothetical protein [Candidatus Albibeggiatoa sp. nov. BB20]|uniref:hypothetical protein n=1 Tax=Candidatus Albibeggiatoa sp. nov. BB20 TaxID=3162723 RepID=UPI003365820D